MGKIERSTEVIRSKKEVEGRKYERNHSSWNINGVVNPCQLDRIDMHEDGSEVVLRRMATQYMLQQLLIDVLSTYYMLTLPSLDVTSLSLVAVYMHSCITYCFHFQSKDIHKVCREKRTSLF